MALILCAETTSTNCSVALASDLKGGYKNSFKVNHCLDLIEDKSDSYSHGERLHIFVQQILKNNNFSIGDLDAIAVSAGPGSYTGLRIGVAAVKGLCYALDIPMIAVSTLKSLAVQAVSDDSYMTIPMLDARRMEVYTAVYRGDNEIEAPYPKILDKDSYSRYREACRQEGRASSKITFIGTGIEKFQDLIREENHNFITAVPTALTMCDIVIEKYKKNDIVDIAYFEPEYLKQFKAG